jgi:OH-DDVA oxygenase/3-O-methylgallate 3,4-dioxygenase
MSQIVMGACSSQGPSLSVTTEQATACEQAIGRIAEAFERARVEVAVIMGNDEDEIFLDDIRPAITVFTGPTLWSQPMVSSQSIANVAERYHHPGGYTEYPGHPLLARELVMRAVKDGFDVATSDVLPNRHARASGIGQSFAFIYRQIMRGRVIPNVPVIFNTFFPPNQPPARRCFEFGRAVGRAVRAWTAEMRVAIVASGGMSHFVIDEELDQTVLQALRDRDGDALCSIDEGLLQSGSSELKNWIAAAGALFDSDLAGSVLDYQPCYRSESGSGAAYGFVLWG